MDTKELEKIKIRLHKAIENVFANKIDSAGIDSSYSYWCMLEEISYINNLLNRLR